MKNIFYLSGIFLLIILMGSCEDFLDLEPPSELVTGKVYNSESDFDQAVLGCYAQLLGIYGNRWQIGDLRADDMWQEAQNMTSQVLVDTYTGHTASDNIWNNGYSLIHYANTALKKINDFEFNNKNSLIAELKFLRAFVYFDFVRVFGDVPLIKEPVLPDEAMEIGRTDLNIIYEDLIIPDFKEAINNLPSHRTGEDIGRATKGAATALLGKVYLTKKDFDNAETTLKSLTTMGYSLLADFNDIYDWNNNEHHSEYIFDIEYSSNPNIPGSSFTNNFSPNWDLYRAHFNIGGVLDNCGSPTEEFYNLFEEGDLRQPISVSHGFTGDDGVFIEIPLGANLPSTICLKYAVQVDNNGNGEANWTVIRYADVLLMLSEAMNENEKTNEALTYLNQVRERAGLEALSGLTQAEMRNAIEKERRLEFFGEGNRWFDLVRWGKAYEVLESLGMKEYMVLWPIPQLQIDLIGNPDILPQNPGYEGL